jgi:hypothetical protein
MTAEVVKPVFSNIFLTYCVCRVRELDHIENYFRLDNVGIKSVPKYFFSPV